MTAPRSSLEHPEYNYWLSAREAEVCFTAALLMLLTSRDTRQAALASWRKQRCNPVEPYTDTSDSHVLGAVVMVLAERIGGAWSSGPGVHP